jgi:hypothetical protein
LGHNIAGHEGDLPLIRFHLHRREQTIRVRLVVVNYLGGSPRRSWINEKMK